MLTTQEIPALLQRLERVAIGTLEDQTLDFKEWIARSYKDSIALVLEAVIGMANAPARLFLTWQESGKVQPMAKNQ